MRDGYQARYRVDAETFGGKRARESAVRLILQIKRRRDEQREERRALNGAFNSDECPASRERDHRVVVVSLVRGKPSPYAFQMRLYGRCDGP